MPRYPIGPAAKLPSNPGALRQYLLDYLARMEPEGGFKTGLVPQPGAQGILPGTMQPPRNIAEIYNPGTLAMGNTGVQSSPLLGVQGPAPAMPPMPMENPFKKAMMPNFEQQIGSQGDLFPKMLEYQPQIEQAKGWQPASKAERISKAQVKALVERILNRQVPAGEMLKGPEREMAMRAIMEKGRPFEVENLSGILDEETGDTMRMAPEMARDLILQQPGKFSAKSSFQTPRVKNVYAAEPGSEQDIIGGIGYKSQEFKHPFSGAEREAMKYMEGREEFVKPEGKPNMLLALAKGNSVYGKVLKKGSAERRGWEEVYDAAKEAGKAGDLDIKSYFLECYQKLTLNRKGFFKRFQPEFKFIENLGMTGEEAGATEASALESIKTKKPTPARPERAVNTTVGMKLASEANKTNMFKNEVEVREFLRSMKSSPTYKKAVEQAIYELSKQGGEATTADFMNRVKEILYAGGKKPGGEVSGMLPPLVLGGAGGAAYGSRE